MRFIVHSTGGLVIRQLLKQYAWTGIQDRIASIVFLAPANFGSPLAHKGKSQLGRLKTILIDGLMEGDTYASEWQFGEVGEQILTDLEMASPRQWDLSDHDLLHPEHGSLYGDDGIGAWVLTGSKSDSLARFVADIDGTDGVIVTSGAGLSIRRLSLDVVGPAPVARSIDPGWTRSSDPSRLPDIPQVVLEDLDHGTILTDDTVVDLVLDALVARTPKQRNRLQQRFSAVAEDRNPGNEDTWQQFVFRVLDDRGQPVTDYDVSFQVWSRTALEARGILPELGRPLFRSAVTKEVRSELRDETRTRRLDRALRDKAHRHSTGHHFRRFLINLTELERVLDPDDVLTFSMVASAGDERIHYATDRVNDIVIHPAPEEAPSLFYPHTTTQVDVKIDRWSDQGALVRLK